MSTALEGITAITRTSGVRSAYGGFAVQARVGLSRRPTPAVDTPSPAPEAASERSAAVRLQEIAEESRQDEDVDGAVETANRQLALANRSLRFRIDDDTEELQIQIIDKDRDRVIRTIPTDEMLRLSARMRDLSGIGAMVDQSR